MNIMPTKPVFPIPLVAAFVVMGMIIASTPDLSHAQPDPDHGQATAPAHSNSATHAPKSTLTWIIQTSGLIGAFLLVISMLFVAQVMRLFLELRELIVAPRELLTDCESMLAKRDYTGIYKAARDSSCELGQLIATGLSSLHAGIGEAREAMDRLGDAITVDMERRISMLAVVGTLGPLIGLLGTLKGMIASFSVIAMSDTQLKASEVAGGISEALILTFEGVILSVPAIYFFALFKNRVAFLSVTTLNLADDFVRRVHATTQKKGTHEHAT